MERNESKFWNYLADKSIWFGKWVLPVLVAGGFTLAVGPKVFNYDTSVTIEENVSETYGSSSEGSVEDIIMVNNGPLLNDGNSCIYTKAKKNPDGTYQTLSHEIKPCSLDDKIDKKSSQYGFPIH